MRKNNQWGILFRFPSFKGFNTPLKINTKSRNEALKIPWKPGKFVSFQRCRSIWGGKFTGFQWFPLRVFWIGGVATPLYLQVLGCASGVTHACTSTEQGLSLSKECGECAQSRRTIDDGFDGRWGSFCLVDDFLVELLTTKKGWMLYVVMVLWWVQDRLPCFCQWIASLPWWDRSYSWSDDSVVHWRSMETLNERWKKRY